MASLNSSVLSIQSICDQRRQRMLNNVPPARINVISPYDTTTYSRFDLDMRRKAEILKYNNGATKMSPLTKKQRFSLVVNGRTQKLPNSYIQNIESAVQNCPTNANLLKPTSASDVPPDPNVPFLYNDETIPLYNYLNPVQTRAYGKQENAEAVSPFKAYPLTNVICENNVATEIASIQFLSNADQFSYTVSVLHIPLAIYVRGTLNGSTVSITANDINIKSITLDAYFNNNIVPERSVYNYQTDTNLIRYYAATINADTNIAGNRFSCIQYIGHLSVSNILLYASPGFVYDFKLNAQLSYESSIFPEVASMEVSLIANVTADQISNVSCNVTPVINTNPGSFGTLQIQT